MYGNSLNNKNFTTIGLDLFFWKVKKENNGYFRKVNFLIPFFESRECNIENCVPVRVNREDAEELLRRCSVVLDDHSRAKELLPTREGCFFGSTDYDEYYFEDVESVRDYVKDTLLPEFDKLDSDESIQFEIWY